MNADELHYLNPTTDSIVMLDGDQYQTLVNISQSADLLANRLDVMLLLNIVLLTLFVFSLLRSKL